MKRENSYRIFTGIAAFFLLLAIGGCTKEEIPAGDTSLPYGAYPMAFSIADNSLVVTSLLTGSDSYDTRSTADGDWSDEPSIVVKVNNELKKYQVKAGDDITQATLSVSPDEEAPFYWQNREDITVSAWWPYTETNGELDDELPPVVVMSDQSKHENFAASDYICALDQIVQFENPTLQFKHRTARITINLISNAPTTGAIVRLINLDTQVNPEEIIAYQRSENVYEALVAPQTIDANTLNIVAETPDKSIYRLIPDEPVKLEADEEYTYNISFTQDFTRIDDLTTFTVYTYEGLLAWAQTLTTTQKTKCILGADITCPTVTGGESNWTPITQSREITFEQSELIDIFDGNGYTIFGLTINSDEEEVGMFGTNYGIIQNLKLENVTINAPSANYVGGIAGVNAGMMENCTVSGTINGQNYVGGIAGHNTTYIAGCNFSGSVSGNNFVGGIAGFNDMLPSNIVDPETGNDILTYSSITGCYAAAYVSGQENVGGVVGYNESESTLAACYAAGDVSGTNNNVGGVVGYNEDKSTLIACCHTTGSVTGTNNNLGGVVGYNNSQNGLSACYWGNTPDIGIGSGNISTEIKQVTDGNWKNAVDEMNNALTSVDWLYIIKDGDTLPTLKKKE